MFVRSSILALYLRIFKPIRWARLVIWAVTVIVVVFYMSCTILIAVKMVPNPHQTWLYTSVNGGGILEQNVNIAQGYFGMTSDLVILAIPLKLVSGLSMDRKRKFGVLAVFLTGLM